jgi:hypothetical protein
MNNYSILVHKTTYRLLLSSLFALLCFASAATTAQSASAYTTDYAGAKDWGDDFCRTNPTGVGDYVWLTGTDGSDTVTATQGDATVNVRVHAAGKYCGFYRSAGAGSDYRSDIGSVNGTFAQYSGNGPNRYFGEDLQDIPMDIKSMGSGRHTICMFLSTFTWSPALPALPSPSACSTINLVLVQPWATTANSLVGVNFPTPNVPLWPANPPNGGRPARPGDEIKWRHTISASGATTPGLGYAVGKSGFGAGDVWGDGSPANDNTPQGVTSAIRAGSSYAIGWGANSPKYSRYIVKPSDGGRTLCQGLSWGPSDYTKPSNAAWSSTNPACVVVPYNYNLVPGVTGPNGMGSIGSTIPPVTPRVDNQVAGNASTTTDSPANTEWQLNRVEVGPGKTIPMTMQANASSPCSHYQSGGAASCLDKGRGTQSFPAGSTTLALLSNEKINNGTAAGTKICFTLSVRPYSQASANWRHSAPVCITVSRQPKMQVWGSDVRARGKIETGTTVITSGGSDKLFGSWVEYGGFSFGPNSGFASGSGLNNGNSNTQPDAWNMLTFANVNNNYGGFKTLPPLPDLSTQFMGPAAGGAIRADIGSLGSGTYKVNNYTITGGAIDNGKTIIIVATGTLTINGDITYKGNGSSGTFNSVGDLPQVIIIAKTINITNTAGQINAWLLTTGATGLINTCSNRAVAAPLNLTVCDKQLTINGPVVTSHLFLRRTAGSESVADSGKPAEIFNLRPDAYLWAQARASQSGKVQTVYSVELPPRF